DYKTISRYKQGWLSVILWHNDGKYKTGIPNNDFPIKYNGRIALRCVALRCVALRSEHSSPLKSIQGFLSNLCIGVKSYAI
ncbi:hypothetical protein, partial [Neisseria meningitidis]|uniref:hypothetical protein n=1 Tax=Neisseria meningitidis TaxID=487 RepID=UPI001C84DE9E